MTSKVNLTFFRRLWAALCFTAQEEVSLFASLLVCISSFFAIFTFGLSRQTGWDAQPTSFLVLGAVSATIVGYAIGIVVQDVCRAFEEIRSI